MKELSIEEKAKRYDEALERAKKLYEQGTITESLSYVFPELKESEDERIRACIGMCLTDIDEQRFADFNTSLKECSDWLKKQGKTALEAINEEKVDNANKVEPRQEKLTEFERAVKQVMEEAIECGDTHNLKADADMLLSLVHKSAWSEEDEQIRQWITSDINKLYYMNKKSSFIVSKETKWLEFIKFKLQGVFKGVWSEGDDVRLTSTIQVLEYARSLPDYNQFGKEDIDNDIQWLKFIRERYNK